MAPFLAHLRALTVWLNTTKELVRTQQGPVESATSADEQDSVVLDIKVNIYHHYIFHTLEIPDAIHNFKCVKNSIRTYKTRGCSNILQSRASKHIQFDMMSHHGVTGPSRTLGELWINNSVFWGFFVGGGGVNLRPNLVAFSSTMTFWFRDITWPYDSVQMVIHALQLTIWLTERNKCSHYLYGLK